MYHKLVKIASKTLLFECVLIYIGILIPKLMRFITYSKLLEELKIIINTYTYLKMLKHRVGVLFSI